MIRKGPDMVITIERGGGGAHKEPPRADRSVSTYCERTESEWEVGGE